MKNIERKQFRCLVDKFIEIEKLDAVILGCTELPLIFGPTNNPIIINTLQILCDGLLEEHFK